MQLLKRRTGKPKSKVKIKMSNNMSDNRSTFTVLILAAMLAMNQVVDCQFFTKSSTKSIPRMGRRSGESNPNIQYESQSSSSGLNPYRRALIDALVDEYGPDLVELLRSQAVPEKTISTGDLVSASDDNQLVDQPRVELIQRSTAADDADSDQQHLSRDERALANLLITTSQQQQQGGARSNQRSPNYKDASLALRALSANRYLKHLSSGQPLVPYESFLASASSGGGAGSKSQQQ